MGRLTQWVVIEADVAVRRMSHDQKVLLADEIHAQQPNMLASFLALPRMGAGGIASRGVKTLQKSLTRWKTPAITRPATRTLTWAFKI